MFAREKTMSKTDSSTDKLKFSAIKYLVVSLATLLLSSMLTVLRHFSAPVYEAIKTAIPVDSLLQMVYILFLACILLAIWILLLHRERQKPLADRYDFDEYGGYYIDPKKGRAICPSCLSEEKIVHMMDVGGNKMCNACKTTCRGRSNKKRAPLREPVSVSDDDRP
jgi:hypothetical protein